MLTMKKILAGILMLATLFFVYACESGITIAFETNGGTAIEDVKLTLDLDLNELPETTRTGYEFMGWFTDEALTEAFDPEETITDNVTLYAKWSQLDYTVTVVIDDVETTQTVLYGEDAVLPTPTKTGYTFTGWSHNGENITEDMTITASFMINTYTITFMVDDAVFTTRSINHGGTLTIENIPTIPEKTGKNGVWNVTDFANITGNMTVTAVYTDKVYTVTFVNRAAETTLSTPTFGPFEVTHGETVSIPTADILVGYDFVGFDFDFETLITSNITIIANYTKQSFSVTFRGLNGVQIATETVLYGNAATAPSYTAPAGYSLGGWDKAFDNIVSDLEVNMIVTPNVYAITFVSNGGSSVANFDGAYLSNLIEPTDPTREGYIFDGWYLEETFQTAYQFTAQSTMPIDGFTLYAKWTYIIKTFTLTINYHYFAPVQNTTETVVDTVLKNEFDFYVPYVYSEAYNFSKFTYNATDFTNVTDSFEVTSDATVDVYFTKLTFTVTFVQNPTGGQLVSTPIVVEYNDSITTFPDLTAKDGYDVIWNRSVLTNIREDIDVYALYYSSSLKRVSFMDGDIIKYIAVQDNAASVDIIGASSPLLSISKTGYAFDGWYFESNWVTLVDFNTFKYSDITGTSATIYAKWTALTVYAVPQVTDVTQTTITWIVSGVDGLYPTEFTLYFDGVATEITVVGVVSGTVATYTYIHEDLAIAGTHTMMVRANGDETTTMSSDFSNTFTHITEATEEVVDEVDLYEYFLIERSGENSTYVFYTDMIYNFNARFTFTITSGGTVITAENNKFITTSVTGDFTFSVYNSDDLTTKSYGGKVVTYINQFALGNNLSHYNAETFAEHLDETITPYLVGSRNKFFFDLRILDGKGSRVEQEDTELLYTFYLWNGTTFDELTTTLSTYLTQSADYSIQFKAAAENKRFKVEIDPKYEALSVQSETLSFEFEVNNGYNVFTDADLKLYYSDLSVQVLNIHSIIETTLAENQLNPDGSPINGYSIPTHTGPDAIPGALYGNVYIRQTDQVDTDNLVINGNYFTIDGSDLPYMTIDSDPDGGFTTTGFSGSFDVVSVQIAIFYYNVYSSTSINNNQVAFKNLSIISNTSTPAVNYSQSADEIVQAELLMSRNSGGMNAIIVRAGNSHIYNTNVGYSTIGLTTNAYGYQTNGELVTMHVDKTWVHHQWANSVFGWAASQITITNCLIDSSGGAAIHVEDNRPGSGGAEDPTVNLDDNTIVNNWVSGQEAWFKAYGMTQAALQIKSLVDYSLSNLGGPGVGLNKTILKLVTNPVTGLETEMFNFVVLTKTLEGASSNNEGGVQVTGSEFLLNFPGADGSIIAIDQPFNFTSLDPRVQGGAFMFAVDELVDSAAFGAAVYELMSSYGQTQEVATYVAFIAGFHNLTPYQALMLAGALQQTAGNWQAAYSALGMSALGQGMDERRYLEISSYVDTVGTIQMITEYYPKTAEK